MQSSRLFSDLTFDGSQQAGGASGSEHTCSQSLAAFGFRQLDVKGRLCALQNPPGLKVHMAVPTAQQGHDLLFRDQVNLIHLLTVSSPNNHCTGIRRGQYNKFTYLSVCPYVYLSVCPYIYPSVCLSIRLPVGLSVCPYAYLSVCLSVHTSTCRYFCLSRRLPVCLSVCPYIYPSVCPYVQLSVHIKMSIWVSPSLVTSTTNNPSSVPRTILSRSAEKNDQITGE